MNDEATRREAERLKNIEQAKIKAKQLELARIQQEKTAKNTYAAQLEKALQERKSKEQEANLRLVALQKAVEEKRKKYASSMVSSLSEAMAELQKLEKQIEDIRSQFQEELKKQILMIAQSSSQNISPEFFQKDEFETQAEYSARIAEYKKQYQSCKEPFMNAFQTIKNLYDQQKQPLIQQMESIRQKEYVFYGHDSLYLNLSQYNPESGYFPIKITSKTNQNFECSGNLSVPRTEARQFKQNFTNKFVTAEVKVRAMSSQFCFVTSAFITDESTNKRYNLSDYISINYGFCFDTKKSILWFNTKKKFNYVDAQAYANNFVYQGLQEWFLPSCDELNDDILKACDYLDCCQTRDWDQKNDLYNYVYQRNQGRVYTAWHNSYWVILGYKGERTWKMYEFLSNPFLALPNNLVFDTNNYILWYTTENEVVSYWTVSEYIKTFQYQNIKGWRLPTLGELKSTWDKRNQQTYSCFNFGGRSYFYGCGSELFNPRTFEVYYPFEAISQKQLRPITVVK